MIYEMPDVLSCHAIPL